MLPTSWYQNQTNLLKWDSYNINPNHEVSHHDRCKTRRVLCYLVFHYLRTYGIPNPQCLALRLKCQEARWKKNTLKGKHLYIDTHELLLPFSVPRLTSSHFPRCFCWSRLPWHIATPPQRPGSKFVHWTDRSDFERPWRFPPIGNIAVKWYHVPKERGHNKNLWNHPLVTFKTTGQNIRRMKEVK